MNDDTPVVFKLFFVYIYTRLQICVGIFIISQVMCVLLNVRVATQDFKQSGIQNHYNNTWCLRDDKSSFDGFHVPCS